MINFKFLRKHSAQVILTHDIFAVICSWWLAFFIRYDLTNISISAIHHAFKVQSLILASHIFFYWYCKTYKPLWRFFSLPELFRLSKAIFFAWFLNITVLFLSHKLVQVPKSIWFIYPLWLILILGLSRLFIRYLSDKQSASDEVKRVLIVGAGKGAELFLRELARWPQQRFLPIASLDDDEMLKNKEIRGVPILGSIDCLPEIAKKEKIDIVVVAIPSIKTSKFREIVNSCEKIKIPILVLPSLSEINKSKVDGLGAREIQLEDLLGRDPVDLDWEGIKNFLQDQIVLVSGGGGSIGSELCQQILQGNPKKLIILDHSEFNLYEIEKHLQSLGNKNIAIKLVNITDNVMVQHVISKYKPSIVFHAAAYKHVPILESQVFQAVKNNILGTKTLAEIAVQHNVKRFILVSTDKAVNPTNIMGATKRIAEIFCQAYNTVSNTSFITVRFGNVIGSTGSVIPLFKKQIANGGPVTVTHPEMTRYFMTIKEASQLILQAGYQGNGGEIFVLDMGQSVKILNLAKDLIKLSGKKIEDIKIVFTGLRPGEKIFEELFYKKEKLLETNQKKIFKANNKSQISWEEARKLIQLIENSCLEHNEDYLISVISSILGDEGIFLEKKSKKTLEDAILI